MSTIVEIFEKFGINLNNGEETFNSFSVDPRRFQSNLIQFIQKSPENPKWEKNYETIWKILESYLDNETNFAVSLLPSKNVSSQHTHSSNQDSLLKILLEISDLQSDLFDYLVSKILNYLETSDTNSDIQILGLQINIPSYIVSQFRYQPRINNPQALCQKLIELINSTTNSAIKKEIIACFPDILCDSQHDGLVSDLELLLDEIELISPTLDTLSNLSFKKENLLGITRTVLLKFPLLGEKDLPSSLKFILKASIILNDKDVFNDLRSKLKLDELADDSVRHVVYDIFRENFQVSNQLVELYSTCIQYNTLAFVNNLILPFDFLVVTLSYSIAQYSKSIDKFFKAAIKQETIRNVEKSSLIFIKFCSNFSQEVLDPIEKMSKSLIQNPP
ncbi:Fanconi anemia group D2 isoform X1, partial [Brachionus plicatilis]